MTSTSNDGVVSPPKMEKSRKQHILQLLHDAASRAIRDEDPWARCHIEQYPAERIIRHLYNPRTQTWSQDETIVKMEKEPFTHGAMRFCYRMKKRATPPKSASNHRFHKCGWSHALNYVAKAYQKDGQVDSSEEAKAAVRNDIMLQYEAQHWADEFNKADPPTKILFIRAYAIEFVNRPGKPWFAVERFIAGKDSYGCGFTKHNTNAGFVDPDLHRVTPQVFSAHSFYASQGNRLVADIQGVGDLYTDPQVLSSDYRFGDGDLGPRGMALFFKSFRHCGTSDSLGIPIFPLSRNELKVQAKYDDDEVTVSDDELSYQSNAVDNFQRLDFNRMRRSKLLSVPRNIGEGQENEQSTQVRSNLSSRTTISASFRKNLEQSPKKFHRSKSDIDEVALCLQRSRQDTVFSLEKDFHRLPSGELRERQFRSDEDSRSIHKSAKARRVSTPMMPTDETKINLGKVHYQLAILHGMGRFPEVVPESHDTEGGPDPPVDSFSVLFHLSHAASLQNAPACLALGRVHAGLDSCVCDLLNLVVPINFDAAKELLRRALSSPQQSPVGPRVAAGCLLYQLLHDENKHRDQDITVIKEAGEAQFNDHSMMIQVLVDTLTLFDALEEEKKEAEKHSKTSHVSRLGRFNEGDRVEANYCLEGTFYPATIIKVSEEDDENKTCSITVEYDDDGSTESLTSENVRPLIPPTATQTNLGGPLSDEQAFGEASDDKLVFTYYELQAELAQLYETAGKREEAAQLYQSAADLAIADNKMKTATEWSLKAADLL